MIVHAGASLHGHEYSTRGPSPQQKHTPFLRSALRPLSEIESRPFRQTASLHSFSDQLPRDDVSPPSPPLLRHRAATDSPLKRDLSVRFRDQLMDYYEQSPSAPVSEDEESVAGSELSDATETSSKRRKPKRAPRQATRFALALPAPQLRTKQRRLVQLRPRLLLQLQQLGDKRAVPAFDVVPSSLVAGSIFIPRLAKRFPRVFRMKPELGPDDVLVVRSEDYDSPNGGSAREGRTANDGVDHRDVLGVISTLLHGDKCVEIVMEDGSIWTAGVMPGGSYEFTRVDSLGNTTTARWIRKSIVPNRRNSAPVGSLQSGPEYKWTFSIIDPTTRRHPIMGAIQHGTLEIFDTYNTMSASSGRFPPTRSIISESGPRSPRSSIQEERYTLAVSEEHKRLMLATGIFVSLRQEGWPETSNPKMGRMTAHCRSVSNGAQDRSRTLPASKTTSPVSSRPSSPRATSDTTAPSRHSPEPAAAAPAPTGSPQRAMSTGAAYMRSRRMASGGVEGRKQGKTEEEATPTCGLGVKHLTRRLFRRKTWHHKHEDEVLKYKLEE